MLNAQPEQFSLNDEGQILYQEKVGNPLPGKPVATLKKGTAVLEPSLEMIEGDDAAKAHLEGWLKAHVTTVLEPLVGLQGDESLTGAVAEIAKKVYDALGVVPRAELEESIAQLDEETRRVLRSKKIRLGPLLAFQPDLNKPAPVRLRAVLWSLFNDKPLPAPVPKDGVVSYKVEGEVDAAFYQMIGYPVYAERAIRIDMLDRVVNAVYDAADKGKFQAQHNMAEWLGSSIEDLYKVLEALGHKKIHDPADEVKEGEQAEEKKPEEGKEQEKPELATFQLKKGKANQEAKAAKPKKAQRDKKKDKPKGKRNKSTNKQPKVMSAEAKTQDDSPFAVLEQLKKSGS